jgi:tetratricopeptide (TPR) repeat protein
MPHIRDFEPILPNPQTYIEKALALYDRAVRDKRGRVVFIAAELGGGKTELLSALAKALHQAKPKPNFVAGYFSGGEYRPYTLAWQKNICLNKAVLAVGETSALLGLCPTPYALAAGFVGQLLQTTVSARELGAEFKNNPPPRNESADWLRKLLRHTAEEKPLVCLLDNWDEARRFFWDDMLLSFSREIGHGLPLLLFVTVKEPIDLKAPENDESGLTKVIQTLTEEKGLAEWWPLRKLSRDEVAAYIGDAALGIAAKLHGVTGGNARWVRELWREWRLGGIVVSNEADCWVWGERHKVTLNLYEDILKGRLTRLLKAQMAMEVEEAREILACAALEGVRFTADAVAMTLDWDRDELIDFLDEELVQTEDNPDGLLFEDDSVSITMPDGSTRTLWRYNFASDLHWMALKQYGFSDQPRPGKGNSEKLEMSEALAKALIETYAPEERLVAAQLARLLRETGYVEASLKYQQIANYAARREVMREHALYLLSINKDEWDQLRCGFVAKFLIEAGEEMFDAVPHYETLEVLEEACKLAKRAKYSDVVAQAHYSCGFVLHAEGKYTSATESAQNSLDIFRLIGSKDGIAISLSLLAEINCATGDYAEARKLATQALHIGQEIGNQKDIAQILGLLAGIDYTNGDYAEARKLITQGLQIEQEIGNRHGVALSLKWLADIDYDTGDYAESLKLATLTLQIEQEIGNQQEVIGALDLLSKIALKVEQPYEAFILMMLSNIVLTQMEHENVKELESHLAKVVAGHVDAEEMFRQVQKAYQRDRGKELIESVLATLGRLFVK